jgi:hypothetical protein
MLCGNEHAHRHESFGVGRMLHVVLDRASEGQRIYEVGTLEMTERRLEILHGFDAFAAIPSSACSKNPQSGEFGITDTGLLACLDGAIEKW